MNILVFFMIYDFLVKSQHVLHDLFFIYLKKYSYVDFVCPPSTFSWMSSPGIFAGSPVFSAVCKCERSSCETTERLKRAELPSVRMANGEAVACRSIMVTGLSARTALSLPGLLVNGLLHGGDSSRPKTR